MHRLSERLVAETGFYWANVGAALCEEGAALLDCPVRPTDSRRWQEEVRALSPKGLRWLLCTDYHGDHTTGSAFVDGVTRVAPQRVYQEIVDVGANNPFAKKIFVDTLADLGLHEEAKAITEAAVPPPHVCFDESLTLHLPPLTFEVRRLGGHSPACSSVLIPEEGVLFAGDVVINEPCPGMKDANLGEWIAALEWIERLPVETIVPGHGEICGKEEVRRQRDYLAGLLTTMARLVRDGAEREAAVTDPAFEPFFWADTTRGQYWVQRRRDTFRQGLAVVYDEVRAGD